jgi:hypothetical protein
MKEKYILQLHKNNKKLKIAIRANDSGHAQAQATDIARALATDSYDLSYGEQKDTILAELFKDLADNNFTHKNCRIWSGTACNGIPCVYVLGARYYIRNTILKYLNIADDGHNAKPKCDCQDCINPYHFKHAKEKNEKISCGDLKMLVAYRGQGVPVSQIAEALKVHRSTIYRKLKDEPVLNGSQSNSNR